MIPWVGLLRRFREDDYSFLYICELPSLIYSINTTGGLKELKGLVTGSKICVHGVEDSNKAEAWKRRETSYSFCNEVCELGQSISKVLGGNGLNKIDYEYNIRGWLTKINHSKFNMNLYYADADETLQGMNVENRFNGNISAIKWQNAGESPQAYSFSYDGLSRLKSANYGRGKNLFVNNKYGVSGINYDSNGNYYNFLWVMEDLKNDNLCNEIYNSHTGGSSDSRGITLGGFIEGDFGGTFNGEIYVRYISFLSLIDSAFRFSESCKEDESAKSSGDHDIWNNFPVYDFNDGKAGAAAHLLNAIRFANKYGNGQVDIDRILKNFSINAGSSMEQGFQSGVVGIKIGERKFDFFISIPILAKVSGRYNSVLDFGGGTTANRILNGEDWTFFKNSDFQWGTTNGNFNFLYEWLNY